MGGYQEQELYPAGDGPTDGTCGKQTGYVRVKPPYVKYNQLRPGT